MIGVVIYMLLQPFLERFFYIYEHAITLDDQGNFVLLMSAQAPQCFSCSAQTSEHYLNCCVFPCEKEPVNSINVKVLFLVTEGVYSGYLNELDGLLVKSIERANRAFSSVGVRFERSCKNFLVSSGCDDGFKEIITSGVPNDLSVCDLKNMLKDFAQDCISCDFDVVMVASARSAYADLTYRDIPTAFFLLIDNEGYSFEHEMGHLIYGGRHCTRKTENNRDSIMTPSYLQQNQDSGNFSSETQELLRKKIPCFLKRD